MISNIKRFFFIIFNVIVFSYVCFAELIDDFYSESIDENVVDKWNLPDWIANATNFLLRLAVALGVAMVIYAWIQFVLSLWDAGKMKKARSGIVLVISWILLALSSFLIIMLINSVTKATLP